jgi:glycosyltransferase involved in cell wall biosynthesis
VPDFPLLPQIADQPLSVILLARRDARHLEKVVADWTRYLNRLDRDHELLLADDGSDDGTAGIAARLCEKVPRNKLLLNDARRGEGAVLRSAFAQARHPLVYYTRAKPWYPPNHLNRLLVEPRLQHPVEQVMRPEIDLVHMTSSFRAFRHLPRVMQAIGWLARKVQGLVFSVAPEPLPGWLGWKRHLAHHLFRFLFGLRNRDAFCPVRLMRREILSRIPIQSQGEFVHVELVAKATYLGCLLSGDVPLGEGRRDRTTSLDDHEGDHFGSVFADFRRVYFHPEFASGQPETSS